MIAFMIIFVMLVAYRVDQRRRERTGTDKRGGAPWDCKDLWK